MQSHRLRCLALTVSLVATALAVPGPALIAPAAATGPSASPAFGVPGLPTWTTTADTTTDNSLLIMGAGEPTVGVPWTLGDGMTALFQAGQRTLRVTFDDAGHGAWTDVTPPLAMPINFDPILWADPVTGRTYAGGLEIVGPIVGVGAPSFVFEYTGCSILYYTDDLGDTWNPMADPCALPGWDHETIGSGPWAGAAPPQATSDHAVYYCAQNAEQFCWISYDGGLTFTPLPPLDPLLNCGSIFGHVRVGPDGSAYIPMGCLSTRASVLVSTNNGLTWSLRTVPGSKGGRFDPSVAPTRRADVDGHGAPPPDASNHYVYLGNAEADGAYIAVSPDGGLTFNDIGQSHGAPTKWFNVGALADPPVLRAEFAEVIAGDWDRAAIAFLGSTKANPNQGSNCNADTVHEWNLYIAMTYDAGRTWSVTKATTDPVQRGPIGDPGTNCRNLLDFNDITIDAQGRVVVAYADGCTSTLCKGPAGTAASSRDDKGTITRQQTGRGLFAEFDLPPPGVPELAITQPADGAQIVEGPVTVAGTVDRQGGVPTENQPPVVALEVDTATGQAPLTVTFAPTATDPDGTIASWSLDYGDGSAPATGTSAPPGSFVHTYAAGGYVATFTAADDQGASASATRAITSFAPTTAFRCTNDPKGDTDIPNPPAQQAERASLYDITKICARFDANDLVVTIDGPGVGLQNNLNTAMSPVVYTVYVDGRDQGWDVYSSLGAYSVWDNNAQTTSGGTASVAAGTLTVRIPLAETGRPDGFHVETALGEGFIGLPLWMEDRAPDAGQAPACAAPPPFLVPPHAAAPNAPVASLYLHHQTSPLGNLDGVFVNGARMDANPPTGSDPAVAIAPQALDGTSPRTIYDANWETPTPVALTNARVTATWWVRFTTQPAFVATSWDVQLWYDQGGTYTQVAAVTQYDTTVPLGTTEMQVQYTFPSVTTPGTDGRLILLIDAGYGAPDSQSLILYDSTTYPSRLDIQAIVDQPPVVTLIADPTHGTAPFTTTFALTASDSDGAITAWSLDFGDGSSPASGTTSVPTSLTHTYTEPGTSHALLTVEDDGGNVQSAAADVTADDPLAVEHVELLLDGAPAGRADTTTSFDDPEAAWSIPTDLTGHTGAIELTARWLDADGDLLDEATVTLTVVPANVPPHAAFTAPASTPRGVAATFDASPSTDADGSVVGYEWSFDDDYTATDPVVSHAFATLGTHAVTLVVFDDDGAHDAATATVEVTNNAPTAAFQAPATGARAAAIPFDATASHDPDGVIATYAWTFGDGASATGANPSHTYTTLGAFTVTLTVTDNDGGTATATRTINVQNAPPRAVIQGPSEIKKNQNAGFDGSSSDDPDAAFDGSQSGDPDGTSLAFAWDFGDGATASGPKVTHKYHKEGDYTVRLVVTDADGATGSATHLLHVYKGKP